MQKHIYRNPCMQYVANTNKANRAFSQIGLLHGVMSHLDRVAPWSIISENYVPAECFCTVQWTVFIQLIACFIGNCIGHSTECTALLLVP